MKFKVDNFKEMENNLSIALKIAGEVINDDKKWSGVCNSNHKLD